VNTSSISAGVEEVGNDVEGCREKKGSKTFLTAWPDLGCCCMVLKAAMETSSMSRLAWYGQA
jgi:hypothetical protein